MRASVHRIGIAAAVLIAAASSGRVARADVIDGQWCSLDGKQHITIAGPNIVTPGEHKIVGDYSRHSFSYVVPDGEANAGMAVQMYLINPETVQSHLGANDGPMTVWHHCKETISAL
jgi:hypothetical protein